MLYYEAAILTHLGDALHAVDDLDAARRAWQRAHDILDDLHHADADPLRDKLRHLAVEVPARPR